MNNKIEKILVATDFSEPSLNALETAAAIARKNRSEMVIVHVQETTFSFMNVSPLAINSVVNNSFSILTALAADIRVKTGIAPEIIEETGYPTEVILKTALHLSCDAIVIGTYGASGYRSGYIGTTAYSVIKFSSCPVLLVPPGRKRDLFNRPLFPIRSGITLLRHFDMIPQFAGEHANLDILAVSHLDGNNKMENLEEIVANLEKQALSNGITPWIIRNTTAPVFQNVLTQADTCKSDLVIITPTIDVSTKQFYIGPNTHYIIHNSKVPVLVINKVNIYAYANTGTATDN